jgi:hypothetical protein
VIEICGAEERPHEIALTQFCLNGRARTSRASLRCTFRRKLVA